MSDEDCNICVEGNDMNDLPEFHVEKIVVARQPHVCCECKGAIQKKERHEVVKGKWDRRIDTFRTCALCLEIRGAFFCRTWTYGAMWEDLQDQLFQYFSEACVAKLTTVAAKQKLRDRWHTWKFDR